MTLVLPTNGHFLAHMLNLDPLLVSHQSPHRCYLTVYKYFRIQLSTHALATIIPFRALLGTCDTSSPPLCTSATGDDVGLGPSMASISSKYSQFSLLLPLTLL